jgi:hypothetical protein
MKAKLIKTDDGYNLVTQGFLKASTEINLINQMNNEEGNIRYYLSKQNCDEIFEVFDVEKLAEECAETAHTMDELYENGLFYGFVSGFNKAMELNRFTLEDMKRAFSRGKDLTAEERFKFTEWEAFTKLVDSIQPTEIEVDIVEVEDDEVYSVTDNMKVAHNKAFDGVLFKYDSEGCLVLTKKI